MKWFSNWISDLQNCACAVSLFQGEYDGETIFCPMMTDPLCDGIIENTKVRRCIGCELTLPEDYDAFVESQQK
ncbi:MAG: hypothetical protein R2757_07460 [Draconibacterium sp.]